MPTLKQQIEDNKNTLKTAALIVGTAALAATVGGRVAGMYMAKNCKIQVVLQAVETVAK